MRTDEHGRAKTSADEITVLHAHSGNLFGGIETMLLTLARHPGELRHRFALCYEDRLAAELRRAGATVDSVGEAHLSRPWTVWRSRRRLQALIAPEPPAVVMCHSPWALAVFARAVRSRQTPLVLWAHGALGGRHWIERLASWSPPELVICNSQYTRDALGPLFPAVEADVLHPPVAPPPAPLDPKERTALRAAHGAGPDSVVVAQVGRLEAWKGHAVLLEALTSLKDLPGWVAWIVGGPQRVQEEQFLVRLERQTHAARLGERVRFLGERDDVPSLLGASDIFCQPNTEPEPFGVVFIEALNAGVPVVTSALGGALEIVTPDCGILVPPRDPRALREALARLIAEPALRRNLGAAGPPRAAALTAPERQAERLARLLQRVVLSSPERHRIVPP